MTERTDHQNAFPVDPIKDLNQSFEYYKVKDRNICYYLEKQL